MYNTIHNCTTLHCTKMYDTALYNNIQDWPALNYAVEQSLTIHHTATYWRTLFSTTTVHYTRHCTALHKYKLHSEAHTCRSTSLHLTALLHCKWALQQRHYLQVSLSGLAVNDTDSIYNHCLESQLMTRIQFTIGHRVISILFASLMRGHLFFGGTERDILSIIPNVFYCFLLL